MRPRERDVTITRRFRRDQEITETTIETRDEGGVRFFIQVRLLHRRRETGGRDVS